MHVYDWIVVNLHAHVHVHQHQHVMFHHVCPSLAFFYISQSLLFVLL